MSSKQDELKAIQAEKKALADKQRALREELKASANERNEARKNRSEARKEFNEAKSLLRSLLAKSYVTLKDGNSEEIAKYADDITSLTTKMTSAVRKCSDAQEQLEDL